jgi:hypothetical protein
MTKFSCDNDLVTLAFQRLPQDALAMAASIEIGGIKKGNAQIQCSLYGSNRLVIIDLTPASRSAIKGEFSTDSPAPQS